MFRFLIYSFIYLFLDLSIYVLICSFIYLCITWLFLFIHFLIYSFIYLFIYVFTGMFPIFYEMSPIGYKIFPIGQPQCFDRLSPATPRRFLIYLFI